MGDKARPVSSKKTAYSPVNADVFISYSTENAKVAESVRNWLESAGVVCWMAPRDIRPGQVYAEAIIDAIQTCRVILLILSDASNKSQYVRNEIERAVTRNIPVIPFRIENISLSKSLQFFLSTSQWLDAYTPPIEQHADALVTAVRRLLSDTKAESPPASANEQLPVHTTSTITQPGTTSIKRWVLVGLGIGILVIVGFVSFGGIGKRNPLVTDLKTSTPSPVTSASTPKEPQTQTLPTGLPKQETSPPPSMAEKPGVIRLASSPPGAKILINDQLIGVTPNKFNLNKGKHRLTLSLDGYQDAQSELEVDTDDRMDIDIPLEQK